MTSPAAAIFKDLPRSQAAAFKQKAKRLGLSPDDLLKQIVEDDLASDRIAETTPLDELAAPFRKALAGASDAEIDRIVKKARRASHRSHR